MLNATTLLYLDIGQFLASLTSFKVAYSGSVITPWKICSCHHELETARINGLLGNIDANTGDPQIGMCACLQLLKVTLCLKFLFDFDL